ncbi:putative transcriptional regulatory protein C15D4.02 [Lasiodiplodia hormozganensis]|uniref:Transcriptional regulatory protein C15D4.02 n=1 Tax=Lasiodiplodia hormozganensis TaxID=869390 RepID=A0AA39YXV7_9PEZI|nr:putative transcriptional regulatory protein C15D4.02 [Lasiodiplodia hormozganensis]
MASPKSAPPRRTRISAAKARTACVTCRNRRVKCDEQRPECERCISNGRICFGYATPSSEGLVASPVRSASATFEPISRQLFDSGAAPQERRALDFFLSRTAPQLSGYFDATFWSRLVLQFGRCEPAIQHAVIAISSAHEQWDVEARGLEVSDGSRGRFTLRQYNKAIARLSEQASGAPQPSRTLLLTCVLFVCLEFLRGDTNMAMTHTLNGLNILRAWQADVAKQKLKGFSDYQKKEEEFVNENLTPIFCRLSVISTLLGKPTPIVRSKPPSMDGSEPLPGGFSFGTLNEARDALIDIQNSGLRFMWATMEKKYQGTIAMTEILEQVRLEMRLAEWHRALDEFEGQAVRRPKSQITEQARTAEEDSLIILRLLYYVAHIWLSSCLSLKETAYDAFISEFQQINALSARLLSRRRPNVSSSSASYSTSSSSLSGASSGTFSFDTELVGPLYFTAIKCRDPPTRRQTLALLEQCNKREGAIDSRRASQLATAIMQIEEAGMQLAAQCRVTPTDAPASQPSHDTGSPSSSRLDTAAMFSSSSLPAAEENSTTHRHHHHQHHQHRYPQPQHQQEQQHHHHHHHHHNHLPPKHTRVAHVVGLPTTLTGDAAAAATASASAGGGSGVMPPSVNPREAFAGTAARLPPEGNRVLAYYEPVMLPSDRALPPGVQAATAAAAQGQGVGDGGSLAYRTMAGVFREDVGRGIMDKDKDKGRGRGRHQGKHFYE